MNVGNHGVAGIRVWSRTACVAVFAAMVPLPGAFGEAPNADSIVMEYVAPDAASDQSTDFRHLKDAPPVSLDQAPEGVFTGVERGRKSVFVYLNPDLVRESAERAGVKQFTARRGGHVRYEYDTVLPNVLNLRNLTPEDIAKIKRMAGVTHVEEDMYHFYVLNLDESMPLVRGLQSQITAAGLSADGTGVRVCVGDTGIDMDHIMYASRIDAAASWDFANNDSNPNDDHGHGSHVSGIAVGGTGITVNLGCDGVEPFQGGAPNATLIGVKILNSAGGGTDSDIIAGIDHCADQTASGGRADVINLSIGTGNYAGTCTHSWAVACNNAVANGVVVVAASGNENNSNSMGSPACGVDVIAVGATYKAAYPNCENGTSNFNWGSCSDSSPAQDQVVCFSNESDFLDVTAPGSVILSASNAAGGTSTTSMSGTSMASPLVAGLAAVVLDADPSLTPAQVRQILRDGAIDMGPAGFDRAYGYGRVDFISTLQQITPCTADIDCDDGLFCNGSETCNLGSGSCNAGSDPCPGQACDEVSDTCAALPTVVYEWNMNTNPGWTGGGQWAWGTPTGGGGQHAGPDPTSGATGSNVYGYNLSGDYANNLSETHLTTTAIDCTNLINTSVRFQRWLGVEQPAYDHAYVRVSNNGSTWTTLWTNGAEVGDTAWSQLEYDISSVADGQSTVFIRWTMGTTDSSWQYCGWNIDDVQIVATDLGGGATCTDGILNQGETRIDCGGPCAACGCTSDAACDDGLFCTGTETCDTFGVCQAGTAVNCADAVACTADSCNETTNSCDNTPDNAACDDGLFCNGAETCDAVNDCQAGTAVNCNDAVACTDDACNETTNSCDNVANNANCDDGLFCTGAETCDAVLDCQAGTAVNCSDGVVCTVDSCNEATNACDNTPDNAACGDGIFCNGAETCDAVLGCQAGGDPCPGQLCDEPTGTCVDCTINADCDDGLFCNGAETCVANVCQAGTAVNCADGVVCTDDACNETTNSCDNVANNANCDDGLACNGAETCDAVSDCLAGTPVNCDDLVACTTDACNEPGGTCTNTPSNAACDDGLFCNGAETCDALLDCQAGTAVNCNDGVVCTVDSCNETTNVCDNVADNAACDDGLFCNGAETCDGVLDCQVGGNPCPGQSCDEVGNVCVNCLVDADCDDGLFCNGAETCAAGVCQAGTAVNCADAVACTDDSCNEATNSCDNVANNANCDNGLFCDGAETCDALLDCQAGTVVNCNDAVACTDDSCNEATNSCDNVANNANCDNGLFCDGAETCDALLDCQAGTAVNCNDAVGCTVDSCNEATNACDNVASNAACDDGLFCNGAETCDAVLDCQAGGNPCPGQSCDEVANVCVNCLVDADCDDGVFCNGAETCVAGNCQAGTAVNCADAVACTDDSCNEATNSCDNVANNANCDNGLFCDGAETCDALLGCLAGTTVNCNDAVACTDDSCNEATNSCDNIANNANCLDDGVFCNGTEFCDAVAGCLSTGNPCATNQTCNEATATCDAGGFVGEGFILSRNPDFSTDDRTFFRNETMYMLMWSDVVDFNNLDRSRWELKSVLAGDRIRQQLTNHFDFSYTASFALSGLPNAETEWTWKGEVRDPNFQYKPSVLVTVLDAPACTINADCDDGLTCNGAETCTAGACQPGTPVNCDDGVFCNGAETCDELLGCVAGTPVDCNDGVFCTDDACNEAAGACDNIPNNAFCPDDGVFCNGAEFCDAVVGCLSTGDPCAANQTCNEVTLTCDAGGGFTGEGFILSRNPDFSTDDRAFTRNETIYMLMWTDVVNMNDISRARWELKDNPGNRIRQPLTNNFDFSYTASFNLTGLPSNEINWTWKGEVKDNGGTRYKPSVAVTVLP